MHIADVSHFIRPGTAIDKEAASRGTTVYLIDKVADCIIYCTSILWSHHEETRDNVRNSARCMQAMKTTHGLDGQHQDVDRTPRGRVSQNDKRTEINGESTSIVWPTLGSRTAKEQNYYYYHTHLTASFPGQHGSAGTGKVKPVSI